MKKRLNALCILVMLVLSYSVFESAYFFAVGVKAGVDMAEDEISSKQGLNMSVIALIPDNFTHFVDSVYNEKSGMYVPTMYSQMVVAVPTTTTPWQMLAGSMLLMLHLISTLTALVFFMLLIISINKSDIFLWKNVRRLRWIGSALIASYFSSLIPVLLTGAKLAEVFALKGYSFYQSELTSITTLVLGLVALLVGEVFAIGLKLKEEQDLTI